MARRGDLLLMFGKMLENDRAGRKVNKSLVKQPRYGRSRLNHPSKQSRHGIGNPQQPSILVIARDQHQADRQACRKRQ